MYVTVMNQPSFNFDRQFGTEARKLARRGDPDTSHEAAESVNTSYLESLVYKKIKEYGEMGCISDEVRAHYANYPY